MEFVKQYQIFTGQEQSEKGQEIVVSYRTNFHSGRYGTRSSSAGPDAGN